LERNLPKLYAKASTGKLKFWEVNVTGPDENGECQVNITHGYTDQDPENWQHSLRKIKKGKNIGRANETTPLEQACSEALSLWKKKKDKKYVEDLSGESDKLLPMLAHTFQKRKHNIVYPALTQPKLNGVRCLAERVGSKEIKYGSRGGKTYETLGHLTEYLLELTERLGCPVDGEIYVHGWGLQTIASAIKGVKTQKVDPSQLEYWIYDMVDLDPNAIFQVRQLMLCKELAAFKDTPLRWVPSHNVVSEEEVYQLHRNFVHDGFEGIIIRNMNGLYRPDFRSADLQKYKIMITEEFEIVGAKDGIGKNEGLVTWICRLPNGGTVDVNPEGSHEMRRDWYEHQEEYLGKMLTVRFQEWTPDGSLAFPVGEAIRDYE